MSEVESKRPLSRDVTFRPGTAADAVAATDIAQRAKASWNYPSEWLERWTSALTIDPGVLTPDRSLMAIHDGQVIGVCVLDWQDEHASLEHLWIDPAHQRSGTGMALVRRALGLVARSGRRCLAIQSEPFAEGFYQGLGARRIGAKPAAMPGAPHRVLPLFELDIAARMPDPGFAIYERVFDSSEIVRTIEGLSSSGLTRTKAGARHVLSAPAVRTLADDSRLLRLAELFVGPGALPFRATLFDKSPAANWLVVWHQDTALPLRQFVESAEWGPWSTKGGVLYAHAPAWALERVVALRVHLDDSTLTNGPLRVLPETHRDGVLTDDDVERRAQASGPVNCVAPAGSVVAMRPLTIHASSKSTDSRRRRVLHIEYVDAAQLAPSVDLAVV